MKKILGLDLGTNSIGWAVVNAEEIHDEKEEGKVTLKPISIEAANSRIIPMDAAVMGDFDSGNSVSQTKERTVFRGTRRLRERALLRRERLHRVLDLMGFLPEHYSAKLTRYGKFSDDSEPKLAWRKNDSGIYEFLFKESFEEMVSEFKKEHPSIEKVPYDWTIYYLRKKALSQALTKEELAWILLNFNQKRGYYQLRGEDEEKSNEEIEEIISAKILSVEKKEKDKKYDKYWYEMSLDNGLVYRASFYNDVSMWIGETKEFILKTTIQKNGDEKKELSFLPSVDEIERMDLQGKGRMYAKIKLRTEKNIDESQKTVGEYIYSNILKNPQQKIIGKLVRTVERKFYKDELCQILEKQKQFIPELNDKKLYVKCLEELYPVNEVHRKDIENRDFTYLFINDILFYQRPLKSKKSLISDCPYEIRKDKEGNDYSVKCIAKSNPYFQEFRLWQFVQNLKIYEREKKEGGKLSIDVDVTSDFIKSEDDIVALFEELNNKIEIEQDILLKFLIREKVKCDCLSDAIKGRIWEILRNVKVKDRASVFARFAEENFSDSQNLIDINSFGKAFKSISIKKDVDYSDDEITSLILKAFEKIEFKTELYRWNYVEDKKYPCNETRAAILKGLSKSGVKQEFLTKEKELEIWHILYSVEDKIEIGKAFVKYAKDNSLEESFAEEFAKLKPFEKEYGSYSEKAIKKLLPLMRMGKYWSADAIDEKTKERIEKLITSEYDENISDRVREKVVGLRDLSQFKGLPLWMACYVVYNRHSEVKDIEKWNSPEDIDNYLRGFKQHSLRNPIVEQVVTETLRTVRDIWKQVGQIDEIHLELGREMKNPADKRKTMSENIQKNENTNLRIKAILAELKNSDYGVENVRPYSPSQQDILKIYEEYALDNLTKEDKDFEFVSKVSKSAQPTKSEIIRYKAWLEQKYRSPYTGEIIPLAKLFTPAYEIEHVIPQSRYFDDSFSNKVICESEVNKLKDNKLAYEFISSNEGRIVTLADGKTVKIFSVGEYEDFVKKHFKGSKKNKLLMSDIPDGFIERQLNDSRYISKFIKGLLSNIVREKSGGGEYELEAVSKNLISCTGGVTDSLKKDWGMDDVWNRIVLPRFVRLNKLTGTNNFTAVNQQGHLIPNMPLELQKGFNKKRIDHRHHAMDAIVIACATRSHVNLLNNESARSMYKDECSKSDDFDKNSSYRYHLSKKLRRQEDVVIEGKNRKVFKEFIKPWDTFTSDSQRVLENMIVSFKQNLRVINKTVNKFEHYDENGKKKIVKQVKGDSWAIRKSMHKDTGWGEINLRFTKEVSLNEALKNPKSIVNKDFKRKVQELLIHGHDAKYIKKYVEDNKDVWSDIDIKKIKVYYFTKDTNKRYFATRFLSDLVGYMSGIKDSDKAISKIEGITDTGIQKILKAHLHAKGNNPEIAFSADGIDEMNRNVVELNGGKPHKPIYKVRRYESGNKYSIGQKGCKAKKFVEADGGTNLFFAIFNSEKLNKESGEMESVRSYLTIPLNVMIDCQKKFGSKWQANIETYLKECKLVSDEVKLLFILSPNDLVYLPTKEELKNGVNLIDKSKIYKFVDSSGIQANFVPFSVSKAIFSMTKDEQKKAFGEEAYCIQNEIGVGSRPSKNQVAITGEMIKEICLPLKVDRLGNIISLGY